LQEKLLDLEKAFSSVTFSYRAAYPTLTTTVTGPVGEDVLKVHQEIRNRLAPWIFTTSGESLSEVTGNLLLAQKRTISTAESCTGGMIGHELTNVAGSSAYFRGAVIAYDNSVKRALLNVPASLLATHGAVSEEVVRAMALGIQKQLHTDVAVATSGIAGPGGGTAEKPVGTVHIAVAVDDVIFHKKCLFKGYSRTKVKTASTWTALNMLYHQLMEKK